MRKVIGEGKLLEIIREEMAKDDDLGECSISGVYKLRDQPAAECNWSAEWYGSGTAPPEITRPKMRQIIEEMRSKYNIET